MTRDDFIKAVSTLIKNNDFSGVGIKASTLGNLVLRSLSDHWRNHGFPQLKDLLSEIARRDGARLGETTPGVLTVWAKVPPATAPPSFARPQQSRRLRKLVWAAFVNTLPRGRRFLDRNNGDVLMGQTDSPGDSWTEITPISDATQHGWLEELSDIIELPEVQQILAQTTWFALLPDILRRTRPELLVQWNVLRSARVADYARTWCDQHHIEQALVFDGRRPTAPDAQIPAALSDDGRRLVLEALQRMTTDELLAIPIPAKYFLASRTNAT